MMLLACSLPSRHLEVVGERENGRAKECLVSTTSKRLLRRLLACAGVSAGAAETMPSHGPQRKSPDLSQFSSCLHAKVFPFKKGIINMLFVDRPVKQKDTHFR